MDSLDLSKRSARYRRAMESLKIRNESGLIVPMKFSDSQNILWRHVAPALDNPKGKLWFIVLKGRQVYATTFFQNLAFIRTLEYGNTNSLIIAQDLDSAGEIFNKAKMFYEYLPLPKLKPSKSKEIEFTLPDGRSYFRVVSAGSIAKGRGTTQSCVHCSEVAFWPHAEVMTGLFQAMPDLPNTMWVVESTANGLVGNGEMFYDQWRMAVRKQSDLVPVFIPWFIMPKYRADFALDPDEWDEEEQLLVAKFAKYGLDAYSLAWRRGAIATKCEGSVEMFHQEYPSTASEAFISSGLPAFDPLAILRQQDNVRNPIWRGTMKDGKLLKQPKGELHVWRQPESGHHYFIGVDTAEGIRGADGKALGDYSCAQVIDVDEWEQVAMIHGPINPWDMAHLLRDVGRWYKNAMINIEIKSTGYAVQDYLLRVLFYPRLHPWRGKPDQVFNRNAKLWGWDTNIYSRPLLIESGRRAINTGIITIHDEATLEEIQQFSRQDNGHYEARAGHDDRVMALLLALRSAEENHTAIRPSYWQQAGAYVSDPDISGIRVIDASKPGGVDRQRMHRELQRNASKAVKDWQSL